MADIKCFLLKPTGFAARSLRRYAGGSTCPGPAGYHNAYAPLGVVSTEVAKGSKAWARTVSGDRWPHDDIRWPKACECGYVFRERDEWQVFVENEYGRQDTGEVMTLRSAPHGAMYLAEWMAGHGSSIYMKRRAGLPHLFVKTPGGEWDVDGPSSNGNGWSWEGDPPNVTARPSIGMSFEDGRWKYHAYLTAGVLIEC